MSGGSSPQILGLATLASWRFALSRGTHYLVWLTVYLIEKLPLPLGVMTSG
jgi:hypothetical protein